MQKSIIVEIASGQKHRFDLVVESYLSYGNEYAPANRCTRSGKQLLKTFFTPHPYQTIDCVFVTERYE